MKDEIKEIIDRIKEDTKEHWYIAYEPDVELSFDEAQTLLDYITNLQEENERLKKELNTLKLSEEEWLDETLGGDKDE